MLYYKGISPGAPLVNLRKEALMPKLGIPVPQAHEIIISELTWDEVCRLGGRAMALNSMGPADVRLTLLPEDETGYAVQAIVVADIDNGGLGELWSDLLDVIGEKLPAEDAPK